MAKPKNFKKFVASKEDCFSVYNASFHLSGRLNHSESSIGIRYGKNEGILLPYVCARTIIGSGELVPTDYLNGVHGESFGQKVRDTLHVRNLLLDPKLSDEQKKRLPTEETQRTIRDAWLSWNPSHKSNDIDLFDPNCKQILLPEKLSDFTNYKSYTPLPAPGISKMLHIKCNDFSNTLTESKEENKESTTNCFKFCSIAYGGTKPQNVTTMSIVRSAIVGLAPKHNKTYAKLLRALYSKEVFSLYNFKEVMESYYSWFLSRNNKNKHIEKIENVLIEKIVKSVSEQIETFYNSLSQNFDTEEIKYVTNKINDRLLSGICDPASRDFEWFNILSSAIVEEMASFKFGKNGETISYSIVDRNRVRTIVYKTILKQYREE